MGKINRRRQRPKSDYLANCLLNSGTKKVINQIFFTLQKAFTRNFNLVLKKISFGYVIKIPCKKVNLLTKIFRSRFQSSSLSNRTLYSKTAATRILFVPNL